MKYSISNRQDPSYLSKADEIFIQWRDRRAIPDYAEKYPNAALVLEARPTDAPIELADIKDEIILSQGRLTLSLPVLDLDLISELKTKNIPFMYGFPASNGWELDALDALGASQIRIEAPLFFDKDTLLKAKAKLRVIANVATEGYIPFYQDGVVGSWIRPEDVELYDHIDTIEFRDADKKKEQALWRIYTEQREWPGKLDMLITNVGDINAINRMIPSDFTKHRLNCKQRCMTTGSCRLCWRFFSLANPSLMLDYKKAMENKEETSE